MKKVFIMFLAIYALSSEAISGVTFKQAKQVFKELQKVTGTNYPLFLVSGSHPNGEATKKGVFLNQSCLKFIDNKSQLAFVLGHELSHMIRKDYSYLHTFKMEYDADIYGQELAIKAGYGNCGGVGYRSKYLKYFGDYTSLTHPMPSLRLGRLKHYCK